MEKYVVVRFERDKISGWVVEKANAVKERYPPPRMLYVTKEQAQAAADKLNALKENQES